MINLNNMILHVLPVVNSMVGINSAAVVGSKVVVAEISAKVDIIAAFRVVGVDRILSVPLPLRLETRIFAVASRHLFRPQHRMMAFLAWYLWPAFRLFVHTFGKTTSSATCVLRFRIIFYLTKFHNLLADFEICLYL